MVWYIHHVEYTREIHCLLIFFCYVQKALQIYWQKQNWKGGSKEWAPRVTNLLFVDDSLLFCQAIQNEGEAIVEILQTYANASGQSINLEKSSVYFSTNTNGVQKQQMLQILGVKEVMKFESYLGLPTLIGRAKYHTFSYLKDRIWKKLQGWKGMLLSRARKGILIKEVA